MKSLKRIAVIGLAVAMLCSFTAFAGYTVTMSDIAAVTSDDPTVTVDYSATASEVTVLAYHGTDLTEANVVYVNQLTAGSTLSFDLAADAAEGTYTVAMGGTDVATGDSKTFSYTDERVASTLQIASATNGLISAYTADGGEFSSPGSVKPGDKITLKLNPFLGYRLSSLLVGSDDVVSSVTNNTYVLTMPNEATTVTATFTEVTTESADVTTGWETYDINYTSGIAARLAFGKVFEATPGTVTECGMYLEKQNSDSTFSPIETPSLANGGYYAFTNTKTASNAFGIEFKALSAGTYRVSAYVKTASETIVGDAVTFTVE